MDILFSVFIAFGLTLLGVLPTLAFGETISKKTVATVSLISFLVIFTLSYLLNLPELFLMMF